MIISRLRSHMVVVLSLPLFLGLSAIESAARPMCDRDMYCGGGSRPESRTISTSDSYANDQESDAFLNNRERGTETGGIAGREDWSFPEQSYQYTSRPMTSVCDPMSSMGQPTFSTCDPMSSMGQPMTSSCTTATSCAPSMASCTPGAAPAATTSGGYIEFEDGTRAFAYPKSLSPGVMFDCKKGYFDLSNPSAGWQTSAPR